MRQRAWMELGLKLLGVFAVFEFVTMLGTVLGAIITSLLMPDLSFQMFLFGSYALSLPATGVAAWILLSFAEPLAKRLFPQDKEMETEGAISCEDVFGVAMIIAGVIIFAWKIPAALSSGLSSLILLIQHGAGMPSAWQSLFNSVFSLVAYTVFSLALIFRWRGLLALIRKARQVT